MLPAFVGRAHKALSNPGWPRRLKTAFGVFFDDFGINFVMTPLAKNRSVGYYRRLKIAERNASNEKLPTVIAKTQPEAYRLASVAANSH